MQICVYLVQVEHGKSFFIKLMILRYRILGLEQYVIDPDREYGKICEELQGSIIKLGPTSETFINIFDIREKSIEEGQGYLATKLNKLMGFFKLIFTNSDEEEMALLEEKIKVANHRIEDLERKVEV